VNRINKASIKGEGKKLSLYVNFTAISHIYIELHITEIYS